jgi:hypothetical protein
MAGSAGLAETLLKQAASELAVNDGCVWPAVTRYLTDDRMLLAARFLESNASVKDPPDQSTDPCWRLLPETRVGWASQLRTTPVPWWIYRLLYPSVGADVW